MEHYPIHAGSIAVTLGALRRDYLPLFLPGANDPEVTRGVIMKPPVTLEAEFAWYDGLLGKSDKNFLFAILLQEQDGEAKGYRYIGNTGLHGVTWPCGHATSGTIISDKTCLGKGYGTEAKLLLLYDAFRVRGLRKVCSHVKAFNGNSWGHLLACGFKVIGRRRAHHWSDGRFVDDVQLEVFREEWEPIWHAYKETKKLPRLTDDEKQRLKLESENA